MPNLKASVRALMTKGTLRDSLSRTSAWRLASCFSSGRSFLVLCAKSSMLMPTAPAATTALTLFATPSGVFPNPADDVGAQGDRSTLAILSSPTNSFVGISSPSG